MVDPNLSEAFVENLLGMVAQLREELSRLVAGTASAGMRLNGEQWVDITPFRVQQIEREIAALEDAIARHRHTYSKEPDGEEWWKPITC
jgi:hypothetical protein